ncbi:MAG: tRNA threonylcarbamoyladenosine dehydratase [Defluviitaleaceae bacterium]|nr:tRNA threonylcarbamoyladenosine dehydratase [Defluviitaleaceae bacterium]
MFDFTTRTEMIYGKEAMERLKNAKIAILGVGGVGSYTFEALIRSGIGHITIVDKDTVEKSNINRQLVALNSTIGVKKVDVAKGRAKDINPDAAVEALDIFYLKEADLDFTKFDYVVDAIDNITGKIAISESCYKAGVPLISAMACGNRLFSSMLKIGDIYETTVCPICKIMRKQLKERGIPKLKVVYSTENYIKQDGRTPGSTPFVPAAAGLLMAGEVVNFLTEV